MRKHRKALVYCLIIVLTLAFPIGTERVDSAVGKHPSAQTVVVSLGDSYSAGEGISPYGLKTSFDERVTEEGVDLDWLAHRSENPWQGMLKIPGTGGRPLADFRVSLSYDENSGYYPNTLERVDAYSSTVCHWYFVAASAAETIHMNGPQSKTITNVNMSKTLSLPAQFKVFDYIRKNGESVDYVTITIGGNDLNFSRIVTKAVLGTTYFKPITTGLTELTMGRIFDPNGVYKAIEDAKADYNKTIKDRIETVYEKIKVACDKDTVIIVAGYPGLLDVTGKGYPFSIVEAKWINNAALWLDKELEDLVESKKKMGMNIEYVSVVDAFRGHEAYTDEPFVIPVKLVPTSDDLEQLSPPSACSMHPNAEGALRYAACVQEVIDSLDRSDIKDENTVKENAVDTDNTKCTVEIQDFINEELGTVQIDGQTYKNQIILPEVVVNGQGHTQINDAVVGLWDSIRQACEENKELIITTDYEWIENEEITSLLIKTWASFPGEEISYRVYNIDKTSGSLVGNEAILGAIGISETQLAEMIFAQLEDPEYFDFDSTVLFFGENMSLHAIIRDCYGGQEQEINMGTVEIINNDMLTDPNTIEAYNPRQVFEGVKYVFTGKLIPGTIRGYDLELDETLRYSNQYGTYDNNTLMLWGQWWGKEYLGKQVTVEGTVYGYRDSPRSLSLSVDAVLEPKIDYEDWASLYLGTWYQQEGDFSRPEYIPAITLNEDGTFTFRINMAEGMAEATGTYFTQIGTDTLYCSIDEEYYSWFIFETVRHFGLRADGDTLVFEGEQIVYTEPGVTFKRQ